MRQIKDILSADITSADNQEKLEGFKRDASAYGGRSYSTLVMESFRGGHYPSALSPCCLERACLFDICAS